LNSWQCWQHFIRFLFFLPLSPSLKPGELKEFTGKYLNVKEKTETTKARLGKATSNHFFGAKLRNLAKRFFIFFWEVF
jgi:hypothetical protein